MNDIFYEDGSTWTIVDHSGTIHPWENSDSDSGSITDGLSMNDILYEDSGNKIDELGRSKVGLFS